MNGARPPALTWTEQDEKLLHKRTAVYRYYDTMRVLLYIGITNHPEARMAQHIESSAWWVYVDDYEHEWFPNRRVAKVVERQLILDSRPVFNREYLPDWGRAKREAYERRHLPQAAHRGDNRILAFWGDARRGLGLVRVGTLFEEWLKAVSDLGSRLQP